MGISTISGGTNMASLSISNISSSGCNWQAATLQVLSITTYCKLSEGAVDLGSQTVAIGSTISGIGYASLSPGDHYLDCLRYRSDNDVFLGYVASGQLVTIPYPPSPPSTPSGLSLDTPGQGEIYATWFGSSNTDYYTVELTKVSDNSKTYYTTSANQITITGLPASTQFSVRVKATNDDGESSYCSSVSIYTDAPVRPSNFTSFSSLTGTSVSISGKNVSLVTANTLLAFRNRIDDFRGYKGLGSANISVPVQGNAATASYINLYRTAISEMSPPTALPSAAVQGSKIDPDYFVKLQDSLNSIQ